MDSLGYDKKSFFFLAKYLFISKKYANYQSPIKLIFTTCETFKWIEPLAVESQKGGLQIPVKISLGK